MSLYAYQESKNKELALVPFYSLIMAAMKSADSFNEMKLRAIYPEIWTELEARYNAPGGRLEGD